MAERAGIAVLDQASTEEARELLSICCGAARWVEAMLARRPFGSIAAMRAAATEAFRGLGRQDILQAMSHHPRIGETQRASATEAGEQAGAATAEAQVKAALAEGNRAYEARFGHIYLVCASGKSGDELLALLNARLANDPRTEIEVAAAEQEKITHLRLDKLCAG